MLDRILASLQRRVTWRMVLMLTTAFMLMSLVIFNFGWAPRIEEISGQPLIDTIFAYSANDLYRILGAYGLEGRQLYTQYLIWLDLLYGTLAGVTFAAILLALSKSVDRFGGLLRVSALAPILKMMLDYGEDALLLLVLARYPEIVIGLASMASLFTSLKLITVYLSLILIAGGFLVLLFSNGFRQQRQR
ncbi:MAG: hypothetical protein KF893_23980 [Caldilineaceae bacterium]|nr:hypothetical protein [Caldilineaceae bacterium]